ncbi:hypothetical protein IY974_04845 [Campylobacter volucris]|uniref:hypothetical protein n=1 Tax=Campylobacter volucris TaxID=1031542 RepID=UPI00189FA090|nr:hypothetical protein [Campylobacter volucris]MBF7045887.1 hypothetical protein [Campylobacter volucris]
MVIIGIIGMIIIGLWTIICGAFWAFLMLLIWCIILPSLFLIEKYGIINVAVSYALILAGIMVLAKIIKSNKT